VVDRPRGGLIIAEGPFPTETTYAWSDLPGQRTHMTHDLVVSMSAVELGLSGHDHTHRRTSGNSVDSARQVELGLHLPQGLVLIRRKELR
jgi:hypothetical protein